MPPSDDLTEPQLASLVGFLANPAGIPSGGAAEAAPELPPGPVVASGGAPAGQKVPEGRPGGMVGPDYPKGIRAPEVRMYTGYGMNGTIVKPPYSTLTAYDLNTGTIKWQVPAGGDDLRGASEGAKDTGYILQRTGIITTPTGLLFQAGGDRTLRVYDADTGKVLWTTRAAGRVARDPGDVRSQRAPVLPGERHLVAPGLWRRPGAGARRRARVRGVRAPGGSREMSRNPILDFGIDRSALGYVGEGLQRPECILAEPDGTLWAADARGGVVRLAAGRPAADHPGPLRPLPSRPRRRRAAISKARCPTAWRSPATATS